MKFVYGHISAFGGTAFKVAEDEHGTWALGGSTRFWVSLRWFNVSIDVYVNLEHPMADVVRHLRDEKASPFCVMMALVPSEQLEEVIGTAIKNERAEERSNTVYRVMRFMSDTESMIAVLNRDDKE